MNGFIAITLKFSKEGDNWVGTCEKMGITLQSNSLEELSVAMDESILLFLNTLELHGEREAFFSRNGIVLYSDDDTPQREYAFSDNPSLFARDKRVPLTIGA